MSSHRIWTTENECEHVRQLGRWGGHKKNRFHHLEMYYRGLCLRDRWGEIDPSVVFTVLLQELMAEFIRWPGAIHTRSYLLREIILRG